MSTHSSIIFFKVHFQDKHVRNKKKRRFKTYPAPSANLFQMKLYQNIMLIINNKILLIKVKKSLRDMLHQHSSHKYTERRRSERITFWNFSKILATMDFSDISRNKVFRMEKELNLKKEIH